MVVVTLSTNTSAAVKSISWLPYTHSGPIRQEQSVNRSGNAIGQVPKLLSNRRAIGKAANRVNRAEPPISSWYQLPGTRYQIPGTRYQVPAWFQVPGT